MSAEELLALLEPIKTSLNELRDICFEILSTLNDPPEELETIDEEPDPNACQSVEVDPYGAEIRCPLPVVSDGYCSNHLVGYKEFVGLVTLYVKDKMKVATIDEIKDANKNNRGWKSHVLEELEMTPSQFLSVVKDGEKRKLGPEEIVREIL
jgi:hypothetical protein